MGGGHGDHHMTLSLFRRCRLARVGGATSQAAYVASAMRQRVGECCACTVHKQGAGVVHTRLEYPFDLLTTDWHGYASWPTFQPSDAAGLVPRCAGYAKTPATARRT